MRAIAASNYRGRALAVRRVSRRRRERVTPYIPHPTRYGLPHRR